MHIHIWMYTYHVMRVYVMWVELDHSHFRKCNVGGVRYSKLCVTKNFSSQFSV